MQQQNARLARTSLMRLPTCVSLIPGFIVTLLSLGMICFNVFAYTVASSAFRTAATCLALQVSLDAYPFDRFPPYISAGAVLISRAAIREFYYGIQHVRLFNYDDIYTGIVAYLLAMPPLHNPQMRFWPSAITKQDLSHLICAHGFTSKQLIDFYDIIVKQGLNWISKRQWERRHVSRLMISPFVSSVHFPFLQLKRNSWTLHMKRWISLDVASRVKC